MKLFTSFLLSNLIHFFPLYIKILYYNVIIKIIKKFLYSIYNKITLLFYSLFKQKIVTSYFRKKLHPF